MINEYHNLSPRVAMRQRREWLLSAIAATTLCISWYLSAALDGRYAKEDSRDSQHTVRTDFDAAFVAANRINALAKVPCSDATCATQLAQAEIFKAQL
ncbi:MAG: hypothetical protein ABW034_26680 [Steroidobacteraceae bacterium]